MDFSNLWSFHCSFSLPPFPTIQRQHHNNSSKCFLPRIFPNHIRTLCRMDHFWMSERIGIGCELDFVASDLAAVCKDGSQHIPDAFGYSSCSSWIFEATLVLWKYGTPAQGFWDMLTTLMVSTATYLTVEAPVLLVEKYLYGLRHAAVKKQKNGEIGSGRLKWYQRFT